MIQFSIPLRTYSKLNSREHWAVRAKKSRNERVVTTVHCPAGLYLVRKPVVVELTRNGPRKLDTDNLGGALKAVRDAIAQQLVLDDGSEDVIWVYKQGKSKTYSIDVSIKTAVPMRLEVVSG